MTHSAFWDRYATDPEFAERVNEEARSITESMHWDLSAITGPAPCPDCGTPVSAVMEAPRPPGIPAGVRAVQPDLRQPGTWELDDPVFSRHTPRRCDWQRAHPATADAA
jgi:hypothetical protein